MLKMKCMEIRIDCSYVDRIQTLLRSSSLKVLMDWRDSGITLYTNSMHVIVALTCNYLTVTSSYNYL